MPPIVFLIPFSGNLSRESISQLTAQLEMKLNRTDDWDAQAAFRLLGSTGAIRVFRRLDVEPAESPPEYEMLGTALTEQDWQEVASLYNKCLHAVRRVGGRIHQQRVTEPQAAYALFESQVSSPLEARCPCTPATSVAKRAPCEPPLSAVSFSHSSSWASPRALIRTRITT
jgi:hypothetical protein